MVTRLMLSLKKAANTLAWVQDPNHPSQTVDSVRFAQQTIGGTEYMDGISAEGRAILSNGYG